MNVKLPPGLHPEQEHLLMKLPAVLDPSNLFFRQLTHCDICDGSGTEENPLFRVETGCDDLCIPLAVHKDCDARDQEEMRKWLATQKPRKWLDAQKGERSAL